MNKINYDASGWPTRESLIHMYVTEGLSHKRIAEITEKSSSGIYALMGKYGIPTREPRVTIAFEDLNRYYTQEGLSDSETAERLHTTVATVQYALRKYGIPVHHPKPKKQKPSKEWLLQQRQDGKTWDEIMSMTGYVRSSLHALLCEYGIERKQYANLDDLTEEVLFQLHVVEGLTAVRIAAKYGCHHSAVSRMIQKYEMDAGRPLINHAREIPVSAEVLRSLYEEEGLSCQEIGTQYSVSFSTVRRWLQAYDIPPRTGNRINNGRVYERSSSTRNMYEFNASEREAILKRDGYTCRMPECACGEEWKLEVHHIVPVKHGGGHDLTNGITLCRTCHSKIKNQELRYIELFKFLIGSH